MIIQSEAEMMQLGRQCAKHISLPAVFELIGDVGTGKTTFTRGLAEGLGVKESVTSPSFTISKRYNFCHSASKMSAELIHYDFYRLDDPGIMRDELDESLSMSNSVVIVEWGGEVADLLSETKYSLEFLLKPDGSREVKLNQHAIKLFSSLDGESASNTDFTDHASSYDQHAKDQSAKEKSLSDNNIS